MQTENHQRDISRYKSIAKYVVPSVFGQVCIFLFSVIDGVFIGQGVGENALGAMGLVTTFTLVVLALYMLTSVGGATVTAIRFGRGDTEGANDAFMHSLVSLLGIAVVLTAIGTCLTKPLGYLLGANETYIGYVTDYLFWYSLFIIPSSLSTLFQFFARNDGSPMLVMAAAISSTVTNIFLDWLFVFPLGMGLKGAAIATGIAQTSSFFILLSHFLLKKGSLRIYKFQPQAALFKKIFMRGIPETVGQFVVPVQLICMNHMLLPLVGEIGINTYAAIGYIGSFADGVFQGISQGFQPLFGNSYGEKNTKDLKFFYRSGMMIAFTCSIVLYALFIGISGFICKIYGLVGETLTFAVHVFPMFACHFVFMSLNIINSAYLYTTKRTSAAIICNVFRSFIFSSAVIIVFPLIFGANMIWFTVAIYEAFSLILAFIIKRRTEKNGIQYV